MSKETTIVFIYDTKKLQNEEDDPASAILYFHPTWVSDHQKTVLCGQLIGIIHCIRKVFNIPQIISLESGKFYVNNVEGRYLLAVGTDRNVPDWVLLHRNNLFNSLISFYHKDIEEIASIYGNSDALSAKMYHMCETYLKMISVGGNIFSIIPSINLPKGASNVFIETLNILQYCQTYDSVLGGLILHHNKVVATQLSPFLTKMLVLTDPYRIKSPAETVTTNFHLPIGVQMLEVYISRSEYNELNRKSSQLRKVFENYKDIVKKVASGSLNCPDDVVPNLKRDCSLLFTTVPEEDNEISPNKNVEATIIRLKKPSRPKFLNLTNKISDIKEVTQSGTKTPYTPFTGNPGSVISTPMTDLKKVLHINTYSICTDPEPPEQTELDKENEENLNNENRERSHSLVSLDNGTQDITQFEKGVSDSTDHTNETETEKSLNDEKKTQNIPELDKPEKITKKRSLTLPLKSLSVDSGTMQDKSDVTMSALLTPLMQKLSSLAFDKKSSGICSYTPTPLDFKDVVPLFKKRNIEECKLKDDQFETAPVKCILFICGQQDTVFGTLLEYDAVDKENLVFSLWELCTAKLGEIEKQLHQNMEPYSGNTIPEQEPYSFLCLDSQWDTLKHGGPWETGEMNSLSKLHRDFQNNSSITEILCKGNDSILYGVHTGDTEIFYHQSESANGGLPTPSDSMGHVPMRAKRSLERDHAIVLL
ncbi:uncharacterized protein LOC123320225 [Coccinella septempunctata]|uniref:uncharacterized protein LOC123320225 n=1 Tax=Coccinella septempunctata TaxID=41139 RepID=UPI001D063D19|nr:uncharacterized protein LOC123320225 [Coccinella septempunctata]